MDKSPMRKGDRKITTPRDLLRGLKKGEVKLNIDGEEKIF